MKRPWITLQSFALLLQGCAFAESLPRQITLKVEDLEGNPVSGAEISGYSSNEGGGGKGVTNNDGEFFVFARPDAAFWVRSQKEGYYKTHGSIGWPPPDPLVVVLKRKINPVPMVVTKVPKAIIPEEGTPIGFDLEVGDWTPPFGRGDRSDIWVEVLEMSTRRDQSQNTLGWFVRARMRVEGEGNGFILMEGSPRLSDGIHSELASVHRAPLVGYTEVQELVQIVEVGYGMTNAEIDYNRQYLIFRVRSEVDDLGNVLSAHYGKIYEPMLIGPGPPEVIHMQSLFYFNPVPNNRSLEFNGENLSPWKDRFLNPPATP